jgi:hypothetical protein
MPLQTIEPTVEAVEESDEHVTNIQNVDINLRDAMHLTIPSKRSESVAREALRAGLRCFVTRALAVLRCERCSVRRVT